MILGLESLPKYHLPGTNETWGKQLAQYFGVSRTLQIPLLVPNGNLIKSAALLNMARSFLKVIGLELVAHTLRHKNFDKTIPVELPPHVLIWPMVFVSKLNSIST